MSNLPRQAVISIDIGSTWTKGALICLDPCASAVVRRAQTPTTSDDLTLGCESLAGELLSLDGPANLRELRSRVPLAICSSAKGGLAVAAIGLVPDLTLQAARLAALSAGAKVTATCCFQITPDKLQELESHPPDILLLTGGTDGGNDRFVLANAEMLCGSRLTCSIIYAGNAAAGRSVQHLLSSKTIVIVPNVMPDIGQMNIEPVREAIRSIFIQQIIHGKGLTRLIDETLVQPNPTPLSVLELVEAIPLERPDWSNLAVVDVGGATTDFYTNCPAVQDAAAVVVKGIPEPTVKRTVEGDLGMRLSAEHAAQQARPQLEKDLVASGCTWQEMAEHARQVQARPSKLAGSARERSLDFLLAKACVQQSLRRHVGTISTAYTPVGRCWVQQGKDLRQLRRVVGTGGYLSFNDDGSLASAIRDRMHTSDEELLLLPESPTCYRDSRYLFTVLANLARSHRREAVKLILDNLETCQ